MYHCSQIIRKDFPRFPGTNMSKVLSTTFPQQVLVSQFLSLVITDGIHLHLRLADAFVQSDLQ